MASKLTGWMEFNGGLIARFPNPAKNEPVFNYYENIASFNLDKTLIKSKTKITDDDLEFEFMFKNCIIRLADIYRQDYSIVVISDQTLITKGIISIDSLQRKFDYLVKALSDRNIPIIGIFTTKTNCYKKPHTWTWKFLSEIYRGMKKPINMKESYYVGPLAGRLAKYPNKKDDDYVDCAYAHNIGIEFKVPEQIFRQSAEIGEFVNNISMTEKEKDTFIEMEFEKYKKSELFHHNSLYEYCVSQASKMDDSTFASQKPAFVIMILGPPCSGKTELANSIAAHAATQSNESKSRAVIISKNTIYQKKSIYKAVDGFMQDGRILIIDGDFPTHDSRFLYLKKASDYKLPVIFVKLSPSHKICKQFNYIKLERSQSGFVAPFSDAYFKKYNKTYQNPDIQNYAKKFPGLKCSIIEVPTIIISSVREFWHVY